MAQIIFSFPPRVMAIVLTQVKSQDLMNVMSMEYEQEIKHSREISKVNNAYMHNCIFYIETFISTSKSCYCREVSLLNVNSTCTSDLKKNRACVML